MENSTDRKLVLVRINPLPDRTLGRLLAYQGSIELGRWWSLELPWLNNQHDVSCIPIGVYPITPEVSEHLGWCLRLSNVPNRSDVLIHRANFPTQIRGCIEAGMVLQDINGDRVLDCSRSQTAMNEIRNVFQNPATLIVVNGY